MAGGYHSDGDALCAHGHHGACIPTWKMFAVSAIMIATGYRRAFAFAVCPAEISRLFPGSENIALTLLLALGAFCGVTPLILGPYSDTNTSKFGRRRIFILVAGFMLALGSSFMWVSSSTNQGWIYYIGVASLWFEKMIKFAAILGAMMSGALMNDLISETQIGKSSGIYACSDQFGGLIGIGFLAIIVGVDKVNDVDKNSDDTNQFWSFYLLQNLIAVACCIPLFFVKEEQLTQVRAGGVSLFTKGAEETLMSYRLYFIRDTLHVKSLHDANQILTICFLLHFGVSMVVAFLSGYFISKSDGLQQRKVAIYIWAVLNFIGYVMFLIVPMLSNFDFQRVMVYSAAVLHGIANGFCQSAQVGLLMDTLANQQETATAKGSRSPAIQIGGLISTLLSGLVLQLTQDPDSTGKDFMNQAGYSLAGYAIVNIFGILWPTAGALAVWRVKRKYSRQPLRSADEVRASIMSSCKRASGYAAAAFGLATPHRHHNFRPSSDIKNHTPPRHRHSMPTPYGAIRHSSIFSLGDRTSLK